MGKGIFGRLRVKNTIDCFSVKCADFGKSGRWDKYGYGWVRDGRGRSLFGELRLHGNVGSIDESEGTFIDPKSREETLQDLHSP
eukprot:1395471-Amorphochlora_amoeboformis.AAC.1